VVFGVEAAHPTVAHEWNRGDVVTVTVPDPDRVIRLLGNGPVRNQNPESDLFVACYRCDRTEVLGAAAHTSTGTSSEDRFVVETTGSRTQDASDARDQFTSGGHGA
jgi:hypothetical protein